MTDTVDAKKRSWIMSRVRGRGTSPERIVQRAFLDAGLRFQTHADYLPGKPDFVFARSRIAVFVNGCFWHWHGCPHSRMPSSNKEYWNRKIDRNVIRDKEIRSGLHRLGWRYITVWECDLTPGISRCMRELGKVQPRESRRYRK